MAASYSPFYCNTNRLRITGGNTEDPAKSNRPAFCILLHGFFWSSRSSAISTPKISMQPIVENFCKHNFQNDDKLKVIVISGRRRSDGILFQFFDNIGHISDEQIVILNQQFTPEKIEASR